MSLHIRIDVSSVSDRTHTHKCLPGRHDSSVRVLGNLPQSWRDQRKTVMVFSLNPWSRADFLPTSQRGLKWECVGVVECKAIVFIC